MSNMWKKYALFIFVVLLYTNYSVFQKYLVVKNIAAEYNRRLEKRLDTSRLTSLGIEKTYITYQKHGDINMGAFWANENNVTTNALDITTDLLYRNTSTETYSRLVRSVMYNFFIQTRYMCVQICTYK